MVRDCRHWRAPYIVLLLFLVISDEVTMGMVWHDPPAASGTVRPLPCWCRSSNAVQRYLFSLFKLPFCISECEGAMAGGMLVFFGV